ncbi:MAG: SDR family NAD(P)-dependent oxidoreductase [Gammaproteobacteria bacterium WSBS_2016_MAG_OTU1]
MSDSYIQQLFNLQGKVAMVTGGASGIGRQIAKALAAAGAQTVIVGRRKQLLEEAAAEIDEAAQKKQAAVVVADLSQTETISSVAEEVSACFGAPQILVHAAGVNLRSSPDLLKSTADITIDSWQKTLAVNLTAPFFLTRALADGMKKSGGGSVINIGSMQSMRAGLGDAAYGASKGGIAQLTRTMARSWSVDNIRVNALLPGFFPSDMTGMVFADSQLADKLAEQTMLGRNGALADLDGAAVFFASAASAYITGTLLPIDGGMLAK